MCDLSHWPEIECVCRDPTQHIVGNACVDADTGSPPENGIIVGGVNESGVSPVGGGGVIPKAPALGGSTKGGNPNKNATNADSGAALSSSSFASAADSAAAIIESLPQNDSVRTGTKNASTTTFSATPTTESGAHTTSTNGSVHTPSSTDTTTNPVHTQPPTTEQSTADLGVNSSTTIAPVSNKGGTGITSVLHSASAVGSEGVGGTPSPPSPSPSHSPTLPPIVSVSLSPTPTSSIIAPAAVIPTPSPRPIPTIYAEPAN